MALGKSRRAVQEESPTTAEYYKLHSDAVRDLVEADESNSPEVSEKELRKYRSGPKFHLSDWAKAILIKMWFAGSVCFFIYWGLSAYVSATLDLLLIFGIVLGVMTDVITNNVLRYIARRETGLDRWMMFPKKQYLTFFYNILYAFLLLLCVGAVYALLNTVLLALCGDGTWPLGVGPILFGILYVGFDQLFIGMKRLLLQIVTDAKQSR